MPTYQYFCDVCSLDFEASRSFSDSSEQLCPECSAVARKVFAPVGVHFKGSGFYRTDSRGGGPTEGPSSSSGSSSTAKE
ncbi:MAG: FmdB family transcriptional regulator [Actinobacteria bacterium]|nr:FmdB family transcriptional regulator [Actinomycetota bacterium]